jgi:hypothetical protein
MNTPELTLEGLNATELTLKACITASMFSGEKSLERNLNRILSLARLQIESQGVIEGKLAPSSTLPASSDADGADAPRRKVKHMKDWLPISSAPMDGTSIILWDADRELAVSGCYHRDPGMDNPNGYEPAWEAWVSDEDLVIWESEDEPTHWIPLPHGAPIHTEESPSDSEMVTWIEEQVKKSSTGVSFDKIPNCEGEMGGFRFMRRHRIDQPCKTLRSAIKAAMEQEK